MKKMFTAELSRVHFLVHRCTGAQVHRCTSAHPQQRVRTKNQANKKHNNQPHLSVHHGGRRPTLPATPRTSTPAASPHWGSGRSPLWRRSVVRPSAAKTTTPPAGSGAGRADQPPDRQPDHGRNHDGAFRPLPSPPSKTALANSGIVGRFFSCGLGAKKKQKQL